MATTSEITKVLWILMQAYPKWGEELGSKLDGTLEIYGRALTDIDGALLEAAALKHISTSKWFPAISELREDALSLVERSNGEKSADEAWTEVITAVRKIGSYGVPVWSSDTIAKTLEAFGRWKELCATEDDQMPFIRAQFMKIYAAQQTRRHDDRLMLPEVQAVMAQIADSKRLQLRSGE